MFAADIDFDKKCNLAQYNSDERDLIHKAWRILSTSLEAEQKQIQRNNRRFIYYTSCKILEVKLNNDSIDFLLKYNIVVDYVFVEKPRKRKIRIFFNKDIAEEIAKLDPITDKWIETI